MIYMKMQLDDWLDDLCVRFIVNLPHEELESVERICFQVEEAQWFYEDFIRPLDPSLPSLPLRAFSLRIFQHCPLFASWSEQLYEAAFEEFIAYKTRVPVRGAIMLNSSMNEVLLVKGWKKGANWSFPRGKINKDERDLDCAIREVYEETGYDVRAAGLVKDEKSMKYIDITMREQQMRLYVFRGVPQDTHFEPKTRKEISRIEWYKLSDLPTLKTKHQEGTGENLAVNANKFYMVAPFLVPLKKWISQERKRDAAKAQQYPQLAAPSITDDLLTDEDGVPTNGHAYKAHVEIPTQTPSDLPEVSISLPGPNDPSIHLKQLLNLESSSAPEAVPNTKLPAVDTEKSSALLALLRGASNSTSAQEQPPQTPLERFAFQADIPRTPHHQHPRPSPLSDMAPPPDFAVSSNQTIADQLQPGRPPALHSYSTSANLPQAVNPTTFSPDAPIVTGIQTHYAAKTAQKLDPYPGGLRSLQTHAPAPYHRTGDPEFARPDFPSANGPAIPPASDLPKLTSHTRALLDVFKGGSNALPKLAEVSASPTHHPSSFGSFLKIPPVTPIMQPQPSSALPPILQNISGQQQKSETSRNASPALPSGHQANLLDLLRRPSVPQYSFSNMADTDTHGAVELATQATPSPKASKPATQNLLSLLSQKTSAPKSGPLPPKRKQNASRVAPTSATVTGPLDMPQVPGMHKPHHRKQRSANGPTRTPKQKSTNAPQHGSIKILPRPTTATSTPLSSPKNPQEPTSDVSPLSPPRRLETAPEQQKPFQPQILRRPQSRQRQRGHSPSPSPLSLPADAPDNLVPNISPPQSAEEKPISAIISPMPSTAAHVPQTSVTSHISDFPPPPPPPTSQSQHLPQHPPTDSHKQNLLSLFSSGPTSTARRRESRDNSNTSTLRAPPSRESTILVSPLQEPTRHAAHPNPPQLALRTSSISPPSRSRIGSLSSLVSKGGAAGSVSVGVVGGGGSGGRHKEKEVEVSREATPTSARTTKADDRAFLMGYLERVARGAGVGVGEGQA